MWTNASDERMKTNISPLADEDGLQSILRLRPIRFNWKDADTDAKTGRQLGFVAQEVESVLPEVVVTDARSQTIIPLGSKPEVIEHPKAMSYATVVVPLVKAVQQLKSENDSLRADIENLKRDFEEYKASH